MNNVEVALQDVKTGYRNAVIVDQQLSEAEKSIINAYRNGANIDISFHRVQKYNAKNLKKETLPNAKWHKNALSDSTTWLQASVQEDNRKEVSFCIFLEV